MSKAFANTIKSLLYNSTLEVIESLNKAAGDDEKGRKFIGTDKKGKQWDTVALRAELAEKKKREYAQPVGINSKGPAMNYIMNRITNKKLPAVTSERKTLIAKYANRDWPFMDTIKVNAKKYETTADAIYDYVRLLAFIIGSIAHKNGKKYALQESVITTFDQLIEC